MEGQNNYGGSYRDQASFWQFSDQLRLQTSGLSDLSIGDSIWSDCYVKQQPLPSSTDLNGGGSFAGWKSAFGSQKLAFGTSNYGVNRYNNADSNRIGESGGVKSSSYFGGNYNDGGNGVIKDYFNTAVNKPINKPVNGNGKKSNSNDGGSGKKKRNVNYNNNNSSNNRNNNDKDAAVDKRFKTLPPSEALPRNEAIGGYIFVCNNDTMEENLRRQLFGLPSRYRDSVRAITPGLPLFLYNYSTHQLHGIFESASFGGTNIDPTAWEDKKCPGESRFPAQVRVVTRKLYEPLEEDSFRPILHHYDGPKFRLELNVEEALKLLDIFAEKNA
ncbi:B2 protein [Musa acuminata AAA Group]|uniref:B2 protein n=1 Tax=Musa acuminata AAA Group TaxID=214697 RepID=UPI0031CEC1A1